MTLTSNPASATIVRRWRPRKRPKAGGVRPPLWFVLPGLAIFALIVLVPSVFGTRLAFTDSTSGQGGDFVGLENFVDLFSSPTSVAPLVQTLIMAAAVMVLQNGIGLLAALALNSAIKSKHFLRVLFFTPFVISPLVAGFLWKYILDPAGALNTVLESIGLGDLAQPWLGLPETALISIVMVVAWQFTGSTMVIYLAALQSVPVELLEAASLDGATGFRRFWNVTRPFLAPAFTVNLTLSLINGLRLYDQVQAMTGGGPGGSTDTISTVLFRYAFSFGEFGYGAAIAVVLTILVIVLTGLQSLLLRKQARA